jgi:hypothetical protein
MLCSFNLHDNLSRQTMTVPFSEETLEAEKVNKGAQVHTGSKVPKTAAI